MSLLATMYVCKIMFPNFIPKSIVLIFVNYLKTHDLAIVQTCIIWPPVHNTGLLLELCMLNIIMQLAMYYYGSNGLGLSLSLEFD